MAGFAFCGRIEHCYQYQYQVLMVVLQVVGLTVSGVRSFGNLRTKEHL